MGGFIQPAPATEERESNWRVLAIGAALVAILIGLLAYISVSGRKGPAAPHPYAANVKITNPKMSAAENFVGATVSYIDGTVTNTGNQTVTHAMVSVIFKDSMGQMAQREDVALHVLDTSGPYPDAVDLSAAPLGPGQSKPFRLTFETISQQWNHEYPELTVTDVKVK
jgi:hypothetical protein